MPDIASSSVGPGIDALLRPRSIALVGASADTARYSGRPLRFLVKHGYPGALYPVNPRYDRIGDHPCFPDVAAVPDPVDLAIIMLSALHVLAALEECAKKGVRAALVMSSGFAELGAAGRQAQQRVSELAVTTGMRICGPNSGGIINVRDRVGASLLSCLELDTLIPGDIALVSQSGTVCNAPFNRAQDRGIGFACLVSSGNEADLDVPDFVEYFAEDDGVRVIVAYVEGVKDGTRFLRAATRAAERGKPLVVLKVGAHERGRAVIASHTGAAAGSDSAFQAVFARTGAIRVHDLDEMIDVASVLAGSRRPRLPGVAVVAVGSGGAAGLLADMTAGAGLDLADFTEPTKQALGPLVSPLCTLTNPLDLAGVSGLASEEPAMLRACLPVIAADPGVGSIVVALPSLPYYCGEIAEALVDFHRSGPVPLLVTWLAGSLSRRGFDILERHGVPLLRSCEAAVRGLRALLDHARFKDRAPGTAAVAAPEPSTTAAAQRILADRAGTLPEDETKRLLALYGIPGVPERRAASAADAVRAAREIGYPVALKIVSADIAHKQQVGGIRLGVSGDAAVRREFRALVAEVERSLPAAAIEGVLVQAMAREGLDVFLGMLRDPQFGAVVMLGLGGLLVARPGALTSGLAPLDAAGATRMVRESEVGRLLEAHRGLGFAPEGLIDLLGRFSRLAADVAPWVSAIDVNPVRLFPRPGAAAVLDAKCYFTSPSADGASPDGACGDANPQRRWTDA